MKTDIYKTKRSFEILNCKNKDLKENIRYDILKKEIKYPEDKVIKINKDQEILVTYNDNLIWLIMNNWYCFKKEEIVDDLIFVKNFTT
jgi:hypothetical protein